MSADAKKEVRAGLRKKLFSENDRLSRTMKESKPPLGPSEVAAIKLQIEANRWAIIDSDYADYIDERLVIHEAAEKEKERMKQIIKQQALDDEENKKKQETEDDENKKWQEKYRSNPPNTQNE